ncbi:hypothetical protein J4E89_008091 [Alternaria sp. Ai002NY15]|nr:hypothetical protein J4E89_008091 [Alternaria sp. Ai002NY15]
MPPHQRADDGFPALSMQPISVDFIENRDAGFRNAEGELPCNFDPSSQKFVVSPFAVGGAVLDHEENALRESKLRAMTQHAEIREKMAELLKEVPEIVNQCEQYQTLYPGRNTIQLCVNDIYINLLLALEEILRWYTQSSLSE